MQTLKTLTVHDTDVIVGTKLLSFEIFSRFFSGVLTSFIILCCLTKTVIYESTLA